MSSSLKRMTETMQSQRRKCPKQLTLVAKSAEELQVWCVAWILTRYRLVYSSLKLHFSDR